MNPEVGLFGESENSTTDIGLFTLERLQNMKKFLSTYPINKRKEVNEIISDYLLYQHNDVMDQLVDLDTDGGVANHTNTNEATKADSTTVKLDALASSFSSLGLSTPIGTKFYQPAPVSKEINNSPKVEFKAPYRYIFESAALIHITLQPIPNLAGTYNWTSQLKELTDSKKFPLTYTDNIIGGTPQVPIINMSIQIGNAHFTMTYVGSKKDCRMNMSKQILDTYCNLATKQSLKEDHHTTKIRRSKEKYIRNLHTTFDASSTSKTRQIDFAIAVREFDCYMIDHGYIPKVMAQVPKHLIELSLINYVLGHGLTNLYKIKRLNETHIRLFGEPLETLEPLVAQPELGVKHRRMILKGWKASRKLLISEHNRVKYEKQMLSSVGDKVIRSMVSDGTFKHIGKEIVGGAREQMQLTANSLFSEIKTRLAKYAVHGIAAASILLFITSVAGILCFFGARVVPLLMGGRSVEAEPEPEDAQALKQHGMNQERKLAEKQSDDLKKWFVINLLEKVTSFFYQF